LTPGTLSQGKRRAAEKFACQCSALKVCKLGSKTTGRQQKGKCPMADVEYKYLEVVPLSVGAARARVPRLQDSAINEFGEFISKSVARGEWHQVDDENIINAQGQDAKGVLEEWLIPRPHALVPEVVIDAQDDVWTSGSLAKQGERWNQLRAMYAPGDMGNKLADKALAEEAALFGTKPGSTKPGVAPGTKPANTDPMAGQNNPYSEFWKFGEQAREAKIQSLIKSNTKLAASLARSCNKTITGQPAAIIGQRFVDPRATSR
jgi:hypothetical protein